MLNKIAYYPFLPSLLVRNNLQEQLVDIFKLRGGVIIKQLFAVLLNNYSLHCLIIIAF